MVSELRAGKCNDSDGSSLESGGTGDQVVFVTELRAFFPWGSVGYLCFAIAASIVPDLDSDSSLSIASGQSGEGSFVNSLGELINDTLGRFDSLGSFLFGQAPLQV